MLVKFLDLDSGRLFEAGRLFEVGANSRLGAYSNKYGNSHNLSLNYPMILLGES